MAAAEAFLRTPAVPAPNAAGRVVEILRRAASIEPAAKGPPKVLVGFADEVTNDAAGRAVQAAGFDSIKVNSGRQALKRLGEAADIDALLIDVGLPDPGLAWLLSQLRGDVGFGQLPLWLVLPGDTQDTLLEARLDLDRKLAESRMARGSLMQDRVRTQHQLLKADRAQETFFKKELERIDQQLAFYSLEAENALRIQLQQIDRELLKAPRDCSLAVHRLAQKYRNVWILPRAAALDPAALKRTLTSQLADDTSRPLAEAQRKDYAERALGWLARMARGEMAGYDVRPAEESVLRALRSPGLSDEAQTDALEFLSRLSSAKSQLALAETLLDGKRSPRVRNSAARALVRSLQQFNTSLPSAEVEALNNLFAARETDPALKTSVALVLGSMRPDLRMTAERLKAYDPTVAPALPGPGPGPTPPPPKE
jgi:CheY-like chemotaxis protein